MTDIRIVCGVDGSPCSVRAAAVAATLADEMRGRVVLVHVLPPRPSMPLAAVPVGAHPVTSAAMKELDRRESEAAFAAAEGELDGLPLDCVVEKGSPPARIAVVAVERDASLIVVGTGSRGLVGAALLGSVAQDLAARAPRPVVVVSESDEQARTGWLAPGPIVCGVDGSEGARRAVRIAVDLAQRLLTALTFVTVTHARSDTDDALSIAMAEAQTRQHGIETVTRTGNAATELAEAARERQAPLLVVGSRTRLAARGAPRIRLGRRDPGRAVPRGHRRARGDERRAAPARPSCSPLARRAGGRGCRP